MQEEVKHYKVKSLGTTLRPNSVYYVKPNSQTAVLTYITDQTGVPYPLIDLTGVGNIQTVTGTGVTGTASNPIVDISTFNSSQLGNLIQLSSTDGKLFVKPITSPDGSISIVNTLSELQIEVSEALQAQIESALQPGDNVSELTNDAGYITSADVPTNTSDLVNDGEDGINPFITAADIVTPSFQDTITVNKTADEVELLYTFFTGKAFTPALSPPGFLLYTIYIKLAQNGGYYVYGNFNGYDGGVSKGIVKILPNGQIDTSFATGNGFNNFPYQGASLLEDDFGKLYVSGAFNTYNSVSNSRIVKLNVDGSIDTSFVVGTGFTGLISGYTNQLAFNVSKTAIYATGLYTNYKGTPINSFARVLINGDLDTSFNVGSGFANSTISVAVNSDDTLFVTTYSTTYKGVAIPNIIKILPNGDRDTSFVSGIGFNTGNNQANYVLKTPDNKIIAAGYFTSYNGTAANRIIKLNQNGTIDSSFDAGSGFNNIVYGIQLVDNNTKYLLYGTFTSYKGVTTNGTVLIDLVGNIIETYVNKYSTSLFINNALLTLAETGTNTGKLVFIKDDIEYLTLNQSLTFDKTNGKAEYKLSPNLVYDDLGENELVPKKFITQSISKTTSFTAVNSGIYNTNGTITITDPAPDTNKGYIVHVIGGTSTIGGVGYTTGSLVYRFFNGTIWISKDYGSIITPVIDANPTDGSSNAVSSNGVFDALASKEPSITAGTTSEYWRGDKTWQTFPTIPTVGTWGALNYPTWATGAPFVKMTAAGTFALDTSTYLTGITSSDVTTALGYTPVTNARTLSINGTTYDLTADRSWTIATGTGTVTSVDLSMPSAFTVTNNPVTTSGTLTVTGAGLVSQYVRGDGTLANFPNSTGGGSSVNYYLNGSISQGTFGGDTYYQMSKTPILGAGTNFTRTNGSGNGYIASFITDAGDPSQLNIPGGNWNVEFYFNVSSGGGSPSFYAELYSVSATNVFTLIASDSLNPEGITNGTTVDQYFTSIPVPQTTLLATDRLAIRIFVNTGGRTITLHTENGNLSEVLTTFTTGLTALNGLTAQVQNLATGTSGTDFGIVSSGSTHTFNLPNASAANRGALSSADWSTFNNKQNNLKTFNTTQGVYFFDDFMGSLVANITNTTNGFVTSVGNGQGTLRSTSTITNRTNQQGVVEALTSANATGTAGYYYASGVYKGSGAISIETYINFTTLSVLAERFFSLFGFYTGVNYFNPPNCIAITYDEGGSTIPFAGGTPNFRCITRGGSTVTNTITSVPVVAGQWYRLRINISNDGNTVTFFIDNALVATHTTNIPLNATFLPLGSMLQKTSGTAARAMQSDYFMYEEIFTTAR
jgi:hypothetical protein